MRVCDSFLGGGSDLPVLSWNEMEMSAFVLSRLSLLHVKAVTIRGKCVCSASYCSVVPRKVYAQPRNLSGDDSSCLRQIITSVVAVRRIC